MFYFILNAGVAYAKTLGWFLKMCVSDTATFFSCIIAGTAFSTYLTSCYFVFLNRNLFGVLLAVATSTTGKRTQQAC